jgi:hypothetical protein
MAAKGTNRWDEFLNPEALRGKLISASLYLAAYEMLRASIVDRLRDFYTFHYDETGGHPDAKYGREVLARNRSPVYASLSWLLDRAAIDQTDMVRYELLRDCRNRVAHDMAQVALHGGGSDHLTLFPVLVDLLQKIETWWILNVEIPSDEEFDGTDIDEAEIVPGPIMTIKMLLDIALGSESEAVAYLKVFREWQEGQARSGP